MPDRSMVESIALAHDITCHINNGRPGGNVILKIDMSKAYDRVSWLFLLKAMQALGFNHIWCDLIYRLISNCWYSVLWDGSSYGHFKSNQGVRQGDPISPSLFILAMEVFSRLIVSQSQAGSIIPYFTKAGALQVTLISCQRLNSAKSSIFFDQNIPQDSRRSILDLTGFSEGHFPTTYLGAPLFPGRVKIEYFSSFETKVRTRIGCWMRNLISMGGRVTIIESVLNSVLIHVLAALPTPITVLDRISGLFSSFLWGQNDSSRRHWVAWRDVCVPKDAGGLGITHLSTIRTALQYKLAWRCMGADSLWGRYMRAKYKEGQAGTHMWNGIKKFFPILRSQADWKVGRGDISTRDFCWAYNTYPPSQLKNLSIKEVCNSSVLKAELLNLLPQEGKKALTDTSFDLLSDELSWLGSSDGIFSAKGIKNRLHSPQKLDRSVLSKVWQKWIPPKISVFLWRLKHKALATDDRVQWCGIPLVSKCRCCTNPSVESLEHLFLSGEAAVWLWSFGHKALGIERPQSLHQAWLMWFQNLKLLEFSDGLKLAWICCGLWELWKLRNHNIYNNGRYYILAQVQRWVLALSPLIELPYNHNMLNNTSLKALGLPQPYTPRLKWKSWCPHPHGLTLNFAWVPHASGVWAGYVLRTCLGSVQWYRAVNTSDPLQSLLIAAVSLKSSHLQPEAVQSCHPVISELKSDRNRSQVALRILSSLQGASLSRICAAANSVATEIAKSVSYHDSRHILPKCYIFD
ncbi:unnamed protein product [Rhodiola kirilowii]